MEGCSLSGPALNSASWSEGTGQWPVSGGQLLCPSRITHPATKPQSRALSAPCLQPPLSAPHPRPFPTLRSQPFLLLTNSLPLPISPSPLQSLSLGLSLSLSLSQSLFLCLSIRSGRGIGTGVFPTIVQSVSNPCSCRRNSNLPTAARIGVKF